MDTPKKILVAEDDKFLLSAYRVKLSKAGFDLKLVTDGEEACAVLQNFTPDVIVLDLIMPKKDGFTVLEELKKNAKWKDIPVIIASNLGQKEDIDRGLDLGADDYIVKSDLSLSELVDKINTVMKTGSPASSLINSAP